jgi:hypothetical protein
VKKLFTNGTLKMCVLSVVSYYLGAGTTIGHRTIKLISKANKTDRKTTKTTAKTKREKKRKKKLDNNYIGQYVEQYRKTEKEFQYLKKLVFKMYTSNQRDLGSDR